MKRTLHLILITVLFTGLLFTSTAIAAESLSLKFPGGSPQNGVEGIPFSSMAMATSAANSPITLEASNLPPGATFEDQGGGVGMLDWLPSFTQAGAYTVTVTATAGTESVSADLKIEIENVTDAPVFSTRLPETEAEPGQTASAVLTALDPEGDPVSFTLADSTSYASGQPKLADNGDGTAILTLTPSKPGYQYVMVKIADPSGNSRKAPVAFRVGTPIMAVQSGLWSDPNTWEGGVVPTASHRVLIEHLAVELDTPAQAVEVIVGHHGALTVSRQVSTGLRLSGSLAVLHGGRLDAGTPADPIPAGISCEILFAVPADALYKGNSPFVPGPEMGMPHLKLSDIGLWVMDEGSDATVHGAPIQNPWVRLLADAGSTSSRLEVDAPAGDWPVGSQVLITSWDNPNTIEIRRIVAVAAQGSQMTLDLEKPPAYFHPGLRYAYHKATKAVRLLGKTEAPLAGEVLIRKQCEVALLTRNMTIASDLTQGAGKAHTLTMMGGNYSIAYAQLRDLGPIPAKGRYPVHFHRDDERQGSSIIGNAIWNTQSPGHQGLVLHDTNGVLVEGNAVYNVQGPAIDTERATEQKNIIRKNLLVRFAASDPTPQNDLARMFGYAPGFTGGIWVRPDNTVEYNVLVAGMNGAAGLAITPSSLAIPVRSPATIAGNEVRGSSVGFVFFGSNISAEFKDGVLAANARWLATSPGEYEGLRNSILIDNQDQPSSDTQAHAQEPDLTPIGNIYLTLPKLFVCGDVDGNGGVDLLDAVSIVRIVVGLVPIPSDIRPADVNGNGTIDIGDAVLLVNFILGRNNLSCGG